MIGHEDELVKEVSTSCPIVEHHFNHNISSLSNAK